MNTFRINNPLNYRTLTIIGAFLLVFVSLLSTFNFFYNQDVKTAFAQNTPTVSETPANPGVPTLATPPITTTQTPTTPNNTTATPNVNTPGNLESVPGQGIVVTTDPNLAKAAGSNTVVVQSGTARTGGELIVVTFVGGLGLLGVIYYISVYGHSKKSPKTVEKRLKPQRR